MIVGKEMKNGKISLQSDLDHFVSVCMRGLLLTFIAFDVKFLCFILPLCDLGKKDPMPIRWGILGLGKIAKKFASDLQYVPDAQLYAVASRSKSKAEAFARSFGAMQAFGSYADLALCPEVEVVYIATPHTMHAVHSLMCIEAGKHVLCEKLFTTDADAAHALCHAAQTQQCFIMEAMWTQFLPAFRQMLEWVRDGQIGQIVAVQADFGFRAPRNPHHRLWQPQLGGGALWDIGCYPLFLALRLFGTTPKWCVQAHYMDSQQVDVQTTIAAQWPNGALANLHCSIVYPMSCRAWIYGTQGRVLLRPRWHESRSLRLEQWDGTSHSATFQWPGFGYQFEAMHVQQCIAQGRIESPELPHTLSIQLVAWLCAVQCRIAA